MQAHNNTAVLLLRGRDGAVRAEAIIDLDRLQELGRFHWSLHSDGYAVRGFRRDGKRRIAYLHREVLRLETGDGGHVDHINRNKLDNRACNLRVGTHAQNTQNVAPRGRSGYRGVTWGNGKWAAVVRLNGKRHHLGSFVSEEEAGRVASEFRARHMPFSDDAL